jgi:hypothetical protein
VLKRNHKHEFISRRHGIRREVVVCSLDERWIIRWEVETIAKLHTYVKDPLSSRLVCNESAGGEAPERAPIVQQVTGPGSEGKRNAVEADVVGRTGPDAKRLDRRYDSRGGLTAR